MNKEELLKLSKEEIIALLLGIIEQQAAEITELKAQINQNSKNSSKPPSSDGYKKPQPKSLRKPSGNKVGGQPGHEGSGLKLLSEPNNFAIYEPSECAHCPRKANCNAQMIVNETRYELDINIETSTTAHQTVKVNCPQTSAVYSGCFPEHIKGTMQYGVNIEALAVSLNTVGMVSLSRTNEILSGVFGVPISTGTISSMVAGCAQSVAPSVLEIKEAIKTEPLIHSDETGVDVGKKTAWAHVASTDKLTYIDVHESRGQKGMDAVGVLIAFIGTVIHDCWASYFHYTVRHGLCVAHLLRELIGVLENTGQIWAQSMIDLLLAMKHTKEKLISHGYDAATTYYLRKYGRLFDAVLAEALMHNPIPVREPVKRGRVRRGKTGALVDRLISYKSMYMLFFTDFSVPFDNNQAERDIRMFKVKLKVSGCFRTFKGAKDFATITSYVSTARKHGIHAFQSIKDALLNKPFSIGSFLMTE
jgi:transposase